MQVYRELRLRGKNALKNQRKLFILSILGLLAAATPALTQGTMTPTPPNVTIVGTRCLAFNWVCGPTRRNLLLRTDEPITNLQALSLDLERADGAAVFPAPSIRTTLPDRPLLPNQPLSLSLQFDFGQIPSGEYSGLLLLVSDNGELTIPMIVRVKDHWLWPLLVLFLGVILGMGLSAYRTEGLARDEIVVQVSSLRTQMRSDPELASAFKTKIDGYLIDVETALENKRWEEAQQSLWQAQGLWNRWRKSRGDWLVQLNYAQILTERLNRLGLDSNSVYLQTLRSHLEDTLRELANGDNPQPLRQSLQTLQQQLNRYLRGRDRLETFEQRVATLAPEQKKVWQIEAERWQQDLDRLDPSDSEGVEAWQTAVETATQQLEQSIEPGEFSGILAPRSLLGAAPSKQPLEKLPPVPSVLPSPDLAQARAARDRLYWFNWLSRIVAVGLLAGAGFGELYAANSTFGARGWSDYFALLAWGFGAEVTRESITKVVRDWRLPGIERPSQE